MSVSSEFGRRAADDELCAAVRQAVEEGDADALRRLGLDGWGDYVQRLSELMNESVRDELDYSPDFGALMSQVASPARYAHHLVTESGTAIQKAKDTPLGIHIKPLEPDFDDDALCGTVGTAASMDDPERAVETLADGLAYAVKKAGNDFVQANAEQRSRAGFEVSVKRSGSSKCCEWCAARIGSWALKNAPDGVFGCHANCSCVVEYTSSTGAVSQRRGTGRFAAVEYEPPHVMTHEEAREKGGFDEPKRLTGAANGGILKAREYHTGLNSLLTEIKTALNIFGTPKEYKSVSEEYLDSLPKTDHVLSLFEALARTNPSLDSFNCSRCVPAYEMIRRGYDVIATLLPEGQQIEPIGLYDYKNIFVGADWLKASGTGKEEIEQYLQNAGNGARVEISIRTKKFSHLFAAENDNGAIRFIDPQKNRKDVAYYFDEVLIGTTEYARIDNLPVSNLIRQCVEVVK